MNLKFIFSVLPSDEDLAGEKNCVLIYGKLTPKSGENISTKEELLLGMFKYVHCRFFLQLVVRLRHLKLVGLSHDF